MNYNWNDILIVGDSFCGQREHKDHWPQIVLSQLTGVGDIASGPRGQGYPGASWWSVRKRLIKEIKVPPKIAIFCHTEPDRLPNKDDWGINFRSVELGKIHTTNNFDNPMPEEFRKACEYYYTNIWMPEFHLWAITQWFKELDELTANIEKVLHFYSFPGHHDHYTFKNGVTFSDPLINYQVKRKMFSLKDPPSANHFDINTNRRFAESVLYYIKNYPSKGTRVIEKIL
jgi:hypothetical protein